MCVEQLGQVIELPSGPGSEAVVSVDGVARTVSLAVLQLEGTPVRPGDWVLSHTGLALRVLDHDEAGELLALRGEMTGRAADPGRTPETPAGNPGAQPADGEHQRADGGSVPTGRGE